LTLKYISKKKFINFYFFCEPVDQFTQLDQPLDRLSKRTGSEANAPPTNKFSQHLILKKKMFLMKFIIYFVNLTFNLVNGFIDYKIFKF
jgi:hypothetical protein